MVFREKNNQQLHENALFLVAKVSTGIRCVHINIISLLQKEISCNMDFNESSVIFDFLSLTTPTETFVDLKPNKFRTVSSYLVLLCHFQWSFSSNLKRLLPSSPTRLSDNLRIRFKPLSGVEWFLWGQFIFHLQTSQRCMFAVVMYEPLEILFHVPNNHVYECLCRDVNFPF